MESKILTSISDNVRVIITDTTKLSKEAIKYSEYDEILLTSEIALLNIVSLMSTGIKNESGKIALVLKANGLLGNSKAIARYEGKIMANCSIDENKLNEMINIKTLDEFKELYKIGDGNLVVEIDLGLKTPYLTSLPISSEKSIEDVIKDYYENSEQLKTIIKTGVRYTKDNKLQRSSALMIQALPSCDEKVFAKYEDKIKEIYDMNTLLEHDFTLEMIAKLIFENIEDYKVLETKDLSFTCTCSEEYFKNLVLSTVTQKEIIEILKEKGYLECVCGFCNRVYRINNFKGR